MLFMIKWASFIIPFPQEVTLTLSVLMLKMLLITKDALEVNLAMAFLKEKKTTHRRMRVTAPHTESTDILPAGIWPCVLSSRKCRATERREDVSVLIFNECVQQENKGLPIRSICLWACVCVCMCVKVSAWRNADSVASIQEKKIISV